MAALVGVLAVLVCSFLLINLLSAFVAEISLWLGPVVVGFAAFKLAVRVRHPYSWLEVCW